MIHSYIYNFTLFCFITSQYATDLQVSNNKNLEKIDESEREEYKITGKLYIWDSVIMLYCKFETIGKFEY